MPPSLQSASPHPHYTTFEPAAQRELFSLIRDARATRQLDAQPLPIFILTCDRLSCLIKAMLSYYKNIQEPIELVIHDNCTTYPPTLRFLDRLAEEGIKVYRQSEVATRAASLGSVRSSIQDWFTHHSASHYVVTDPDIEIEAGAGDLLGALKHVLSEVAHIDAAGPMLRRDDIPDHYPLKAKVHEQQDRLYLPEKQWIIKWQAKALLAQSGWVDTAFALYRCTFPFRNLNRSIQLHEPYVAKHSDWYIDPLRLTPDQIYYKQKNNPVGHWSSSWLPNDVLEKQIPGRDMTRKESYKIVRKKTPAEQQL